MIPIILILTIMLPAPVDDTDYNYVWTPDDMIPIGLDTFETQWETPFPFEIPKTVQIKKSSSGSITVITDTGNNVTIPSGDLYEVELEEELEFKDKMKEKYKKGKKPKK